MKFSDLTQHLDDADALEAHLQTEYVHDIIERGNDHPYAKLDYHGSRDLNVGREDITPDEFALDYYTIADGGMGGVEVHVRASASTFLPTKNCEYGPGGHDLEYAESHLVYRARASFPTGTPYLVGTVFVVTRE